MAILSGATFTDATTGGLTIFATNHGTGDTGATAMVNNAGTFTKSGGAATSTISTLFNNSGTVNITSGTLNLSGGGTDVGALYQSAGTIEFGGGTRTLDATSSITGNALFAGNAATVTTVNGGVGTGLMTITAGTVNFNGAVSTGAFTQTGGELSGSGSLMVTGAANFSGGTQSGSATTLAQGGVAFTSAAFGLDGGRTLRLGGSSSASGTSVTINLNNTNPNTSVSDLGSGTLTILSGATFNDQTTGAGLQILATNRGGSDTGAAAAVNNAGTFTKSGSAGSSVSTLFNNTGTVNVQSGTLNLSGGGNDIGAIYSGAGTLEFGGGTRSFRGNNTITTSTLDNLGTMSLLNGTLAVLGSLVGTGSITIGSNSLLELGGASAQKVTFLTSNGSLKLDQPSTFTGTITGLAVGDVIDLVGTQAQTATINGSTLTIKNSGGTTIATYNIAGALTGNAFVTYSDGAGGTDLILIGAAPNVLTSPPPIDAGSINPAPSATAPVYELSGASITGPGGHGLNLVTTDTNTADTLTVQMDAASSISVSGNTANGLNLQTSGANIVVNTAGPISASGAGGTGIFANVQAGNGSVSVNTLANVSGASDGIRAFTNSNGTGSVNVYAGQNVTITGTAFVGIYASTLGSGDVSVSTAPGDMIASGSAGIIAENYSTSIAASAQSSIDVTASGTINSGPTGFSNGNRPSGILAGYFPGGNASSFNPSVFGDVNVINFANITASGFSGIFGYNYGTGNITLNDGPNTTITNTIATSAGYGITATNYGPGNISISTSPGDVITTSSAGVVGASYATAVPATGSIVINTSGAINSGVTPLNSGGTVAGVLGIYVGGTSNPANPPNPAVFGNITIDNSANVKAAGGDGIRAQNYGVGNITIIDEPNTNITATGDSSSRYGIFAQNLGPGNILVATSAGDIINSASAGIQAVNNAASVSPGTSVVVTANGTINSGTVPSGNGTPAAGILAGYNFNTNPDPNVVGNVIIDDFASITAPSGTDGIRGFNYGVGPGTVSVIAESAAVISAGRFGIAANGNSTVGISVVSSGVVSGGTAGISVGAVTNGTLNGNVDVEVIGGSVSSPTTAIQINTSGVVSIVNDGQIIHGTVAGPSATGIAISDTSGNVTIDNSNLIVGDVALATTTFDNHSGATWNVSGSNTFGAGANTIINDGTINVLGNSSFIATGTLNITGSGSVTIADGATLEIGGSIAASQTVTFSTTTTTETLKIDQSLTAPFNAHISGLTGSPNDVIDLADLTYGPNTTAVYTPITSTSGTLTVSDGNPVNPHTVILNLTNYTGTGSFTTSSDTSHGGAGGTWVVDPPAEQEIASGTFVFKDLSDAQTATVSPANGGVGYVGSLSVDAPNKSNGQETVDWHFNLDQATVKQTVTQTYNVAVTDVHPDGTSSTITQAYSLTIGGPGNDSFVFKPGFGADTIVNAKSSDTIELDGFSSISSIDELQTLLHEAQTGQVQTLFQTANAGHDTVINLGNNDVITLENVHLADLHSSNFIIHV